MAEWRYRAPLHPSYSFSGSSTADSSSRSLKRRFTSTDTDADTAHTATSSTATTSDMNEQTRNQPANRATVSTRNHSAINAGLPLDPSPSDLGAIFIHPPFTAFPDAFRYKDGLTFNLMALHEDWFLDPTDFISANNKDTTAIRYPPQLEPPRGWCLKTKDKDVKGGWPDGEEPRLRCTFCRRSYSGVNAKSMWRRHVYEKHKIAMSNRRDNNERKGRGSNKENRSAEGGGRNGDRTTRRSSTNANNTDEDDDANDMLKAKFCRSKSGSSSEWQSASARRHDDENAYEEANALQEPELLPSAFSQIVDENDLFSSVISSNTPPLTPGRSPSTFRRPGPLNIVPESPYNPLLTPSFRHSPPRLPSDQPWRFPSPSHPLHSRAREISLCMLVRGEASPVVSGLDVSPVVIVPASEREKRSIFSSPLAPPSNKGTPASLFQSFPRPSPRRLFHDSVFPTPITDRVEFRKHRIPESPLGRGSSSRKSEGKSSPTNVNAWLASSPFNPKRATEGSGLLCPIELQEDPFVDSSYTSWVDLSGSANESSRELSPPVSSPEEEAESPECRTSSQPPQAGSSTSNSTKPKSFSGLGVGLMDAFLLRGRAGIRRETDVDMSSDDHDGGDEAEVEHALAESPLVQAGKKTRRGYLSSSHRGEDGEYGMLDMRQSKRRRKTISGYD